MKALLIVALLAVLCSCAQPVEESQEIMLHCDLLDGDTAIIELQTRNYGEDWRIYRLYRTPPYTPAELLDALHVWRHLTGHGMDWECFTWPSEEAMIIRYRCSDTTCAWREVRP